MKYRLVCFDVDGTLIENGNHTSYWKLMEREFGITPEERAEWKRRFRSGKISYAGWCDLDLQWIQERGVTRDQLEELARRQQLIPGVREALQELKRRGYRLAVISGGIDLGLLTLFPNHPFDDMLICRTRFDAQGRIVDWESQNLNDEGKTKAMHRILAREGIDISETVFVGDGENDIAILKEAGLGIAFCPKSNKVREAADVVIEKRDVREILKHLG